MNETKYKLLKAELKGLQKECDALREQRRQEIEPPLHLALVISVSDDKKRAIVTTSKRTLVEVSVSYRIKDTVDSDVVVGLTRSGLIAVKAIDMNADMFKKIVMESEIL